MKDEPNYLIYVEIDCEDLLCLFPGGKFWHNKSPLKRKNISFHISYPHGKNLFTVILYCCCVPAIIEQPNAKRNIIQSEQRHNGY